MTDVSLTLRPNPLEMATQTHLMPSGMTIAEMLDCLPTGLPAGFDELGVVNLNGHIVPRELWRAVRVKRDGGDKPVCLALYIVPGTGGGGQGGGKTTLALVASIAVIAATAWVGGGALVPILGTGFAAGTIGAAAASAAVGIAGTLAISALAPPPLRPSTRRQETGGGRTAPADYAGISANPLEPLASIPTVLGEVMASPPHLIRPYTKMVNKVIHAYACVGFAGALDITDVRINGVPEATFTDVDVHLSETGGAQTLATENVWEEAPNEPLSSFILDETDTGEGDTGRILEDQATPTNSTPKYHYYRTRGIPDKVRIRLLWPNGLFKIGAVSGEVRYAIQSLRIEVRRVGDVSWINLPQIFYNSNSQQQLRSQITLSWGTTNASQLLGLLQFHFTALWTTGDGTAWEYNANSIYQFGASPTAADNIERDGGSTAAQGWIIHMPLATFPQNAEYEVRIKRGKVSDANGTSAGPDDDFFGFETEVGVDKVPGNDADDSQVLGQGMIVVESFQTVRDGLPLDPTDLSYIEVETIGLQIQTISALWCSKGNNLSGTVWGVAGTSRMQNPASIYRHVLTSTVLNAEPLSSALLEDQSGESLQTWYNHCNANNLECNMIVDGRSVEEVLQIVAACGHAAVRRSDKWGVIIEKDRTADPIVQLFSQRNTWNNAVKKLFADPPLDALFVTFPNEAEDFVPDELTEIFSGGANIEAIEYPGITNTSRIQERARLDLRQRAYRNRFYSFQTDMQGIVSQRGDLVGYVFDVIDQYKFDARINAVKFNTGGEATGLVLDSYFDFFSIVGDIYAAEDVYALADVYGGAESMGIVIHKLDGTFVTRTIDLSDVTSDTGEINEITFTAVISGLAGNDDDFIGAHVVVGILTEEYRRCLIFDIAWDQDLTARLTLVDEAPEIHPL